jgi:hypothetical protein
MSKNNVAFGLERYDEVSAIPLDRHLSPSSISTRFKNPVGTYRHHAPLKLLCSVRKDAADRAPRQRRAELSTTERGLVETAAENSPQRPREVRSPPEST